MKRIVFSLLLLCALGAKGQGSYSGCYLASTNTVYTSEPFNNNRFLPVTGARPLSPGYCSWRPTTGTSCIVCLGGIQTYGGLYSSCTNPATGVENTFTMVLCSLDGLTAYMLIMVGGSGAFLLRRAKKSALQF